jgi:hypothetical protein
MDVKLDDLEHTDAVKAGKVWSGSPHFRLDGEDRSGG